MRFEPEPSEDAERSGAGVMDAAYVVHSAFGPAGLEGTYRKALVIALRNRGHIVEEEVWLDLVFEGVTLPRAFRMDVVVDGRVVIEVKAVEHLLPVHHAQLVSYLRLSGLELGYLLNFHVPRMKHGIHRKANTRPFLPASRPSRG